MLFIPSPFVARDAAASILSYRRDRVVGNRVGGSIPPSGRGIPSDAERTFEILKLARSGSRPSMPQDDTTLYILLVVALVAILGVGLSVASFVTDQSVGGMMGGGSGMMNGGGTTRAAGPGAVEWTILLISATFFVFAVVLLLRRRGPEPAASTGTAAPAMPVAAPRSEPAQAPESSAVEPPSPSSPSAPSIAEPTLVKLLDEDERRMYLELRDHGGQMFQRDLVALGIFSKAKVTRVLDKLETKGLVIREAHGMTNRVRLVPQPPK
jgi:uncharacterized membrane protein